MKCVFFRLLQNIYNQLFRSQLFYVFFFNQIVIKLFFIYSHKHFSDKIFLDCGNLYHNLLFLNLFFLHPPENQEFSYPDFRICVFQVPGKSQIFLDKKDLQLAISTNNTVFFSLFFINYICVNYFIFNSEDFHSKKYNHSFSCSQSQKTYNPAQFERTISTLRKV